MSAAHDSIATRLEGSIVTVQGGRRVRKLPPMAIRREEKIKFYSFPQTETRGGHGTWCKIDGDIVVTCPRCATSSVVDIAHGLDDAYKIDAKGLLFPSFLCPQAYCDLDHYVVLSGWVSMGKLGRPRDNARGIVLYAMCWVKEKRMADGSVRFALMPTEYTHAVSRATAIASWEPFIAAESARGVRAKMIEVAPAIDPHVGGFDDPKNSVHLYGG